jgi:hypothetical protein
MTIVTRFWRYVNKSGPTVRAELGPCWDWTGGRGPQGYGIFQLRSYTPCRAHRVSWELSTQAPIPLGLCVCHKCDRPCCVNPAHLFLGSKADNARDMAAKGRMPIRIEARHAEELRARWAIGNVSKTTLAHTYRISMGSVRRILVNDPTITYLRETSS